jgi:ferric-dicitrate binding protein FerR (iron transport regulator)
VKDKRETAAFAEVNCQRLGDLAGFATLADVRAPAAEQWGEIERRLDRRRGGLLLSRRWPALAVCAVAVLCTAGWLVARRPLGYHMEGCTLAADGVFATATDREGVVTFDDGSRMSVDKAARFRLRMLPFGHGSEISLDDGEAHLAVVHRSEARWAVLTGPFRIDVTGTRFGVRWSQQLGRFRVTLLEGEVSVAGGAIPPATRLRAGQTLDADWVASTFKIANGQDSPAEVPRAAASNAAHAARTAKLDSTPQRGSRLSPMATPPRKHSEAFARGENSASGEAARPSAQFSPSEPVNPEPTAAPMAPQLLPPSPFAVGPTEPAPAPGHKGGTIHVVFGETGQLAKGLSGATWVAGGEGASFSTPASWDDRAQLRPEAGLLCTSGTVAGLSCVNEGTPRVLCNWDRNWGVAIGWNTRADQKAWGDDATRSIAVEFHGRSASYRLNAHLKGDPSERIYCIENYKSGQVVRPSMFKSECWLDRGDTLADFTRVDLFNLQFSSGASYVAFRYCISGITLYP